MRALPRRPGFTLIELLVVIAIIALLIGLLLPSLGAAKLSGKATVCLANTRAIGMASQYYAHDNKTLVIRGDTPLWYDVYLPYMNERAGNLTSYKQVKAYRCPNFPNPAQTIQFVINGWHFDGPFDTLGSPINTPTKMEVFERPSKTAYITENDDGAWRPIITDLSSGDLKRQDIWNVGHLPTSTDTSDDHGRRISPNRHFDGCNVVFVDGHATFMKARQMTVDTWRDRWH